MFILTIKALLYSVLLYAAYSLELNATLNSERNIALEGFTYKDFTAFDLSDCFEKCLGEGVCQSINFNLLSSLCEFNNDVKRFNPTNSRQRYLGVYMENPKRAKKGSALLLAGRSCKAIKDAGEAEGDGEYWIDPEGTGKPFTVFCDMTTDSGGWTLVKRTKLQTTTPSADRVYMKDDDYKGITNYTNNKVFILVPAIRKLRDFIGFHQVRWRCSKKSLGRTLHIMTTNDSAGYNVLMHYLDKPKLQPPACNSFVRLPDDNSILAQNCMKWGNTGSSVQVNKWGRYTNTGNWRIYNNVIVWESKYYLTFISGNFYCDDFTGNYGALSIGDQWELFVR